MSRFRFNRQTRRLFRAKIKPWLQEGHSRKDIRGMLMKEGFTWPDGSPISDVAIGKHAIAMGFRTNRSSRGTPRRVASSGLPRRNTSSDNRDVFLEILADDDLTPKERVRLLAYQLKSYARHHGVSPVTL